MTASKRSRAKPEAGEPVLQFRLRIMHHGEIALGPGKVELLTAIQAHGSISKGARSLGMSYMRAWMLVKVMNKAFREPLVVVERGGTQGGAARLTELGRQVLGIYSDLIEQSRLVSKPAWSELQKLLNQ